MKETMKRIRKLSEQKTLANEAQRLDQCLEIFNLAKSSLLSLSHRRTLISPRLSSVCLYKFESRERIALPRYLPRNRIKFDEIRSRITKLLHLER